MLQRVMAIAFALGAAAPAAGQTYDFATLGFRFEAPEAYDVTQEGITVKATDAETGDVVEITPFAVTNRDASRERRAMRWFEQMGYELSGSDEVRADGSVLVIAEGGDGSSFVMVRDLYVDSDGGLRVVVHADASDPARALAIARGVEVTDPSPLLTAARAAGAID